MWKKHSEILAPLTELTSTKKARKWSNKQQNAFNTMKKIMAQETILAYSNFEISFEIHTDASAYQLVQSYHRMEDQWPSIHRSQPLHKLGTILLNQNYYPLSKPSKNFEQYD
jgi:hypothetical protein